MIVELFPFQKRALEALRSRTAEALGGYNRTGVPQIVSYTAPTGAGKTIIMSALIESIFFGDGKYTEQPEAIFVWLSDSPELNEQSKLKIDTKADRIRLSQCITIDEASFNEEILQDGNIYFLNTQKLGKSSNLTKHSDHRQYTIWETLENTIREKHDRLYFIIDEAHRGTKGREAGKATTIMQKFILGSPENNLPPMPVVIGMTATSSRFLALAGSTTSTIQKVVTTADEVRASGLLKERIVITYPDRANNDMAVLQAATDEWKDKWQHWTQYCFEQHYAYVNPIFVVQVLNSTSPNRVSDTNLDDCLMKIEDRLGEHFVEGQVVHAFGDKTSVINIGGLNVRYVEPSRISDDKNIKLVFFKESLSTGWDCPRAETMMSFRRAVDATYIAQLLGRMVRTPMQMHINVDESLNDVHLFLPYFDSATVKAVVEELQNSEGGNIPTYIEEQEYGTQNTDTLTIHPTYRTPPARRPRPQVPGQISALDSFGQINPDIMQNANQSIISPNETDNAAAAEQSDNTQNQPQTSGQQEVTSAEVPHFTEEAASLPEDEFPAIEEIFDPGFDREEVCKAINSAGLLTYNVRTVQITNYLKSMFKLARVITRALPDSHESDSVYNDISDMIHDYINSLKTNGLYKDLCDKVLQFKLNMQVYDVFGQTVDNYTVHDIFSTTDADIERQYRQADYKLGAEGIGRAYGIKYSLPEEPGQYQIDVILFAADNDCVNKLNNYAKEKFHYLADEYRLRAIHFCERFKKDYDDAVSNGDIISKHNFKLPETIQVQHADDGKIYTNHLFVDDSGIAKIKLNNWEEKVIEEESKRPDFVCWLRNPPRKSWALCIPYQKGNNTESMYPDFLIIRKDEYIGYTIDVLEPHNPSFDDNLSKAKGMAEYARQNPGVGRIQLIRVVPVMGESKLKRLDLGKMSVREKVRSAMTSEELDHIFDTDGFID